MGIPSANRGVVASISDRRRRSETAAWSFYICRALYLRIPLPSPPWGRGWIASGAFISRGETGEGVLSERLIQTPPVTTTRRPRFFAQYIRPPDDAVRGRSTTPLVRCPLACGEVRALSGFVRRSEQENAWCDKDARHSWFPPCPRLLTPSPVSPRLMTTPVARHPLPQGGEGKEFTRTGHDHRNYPGPDAFVPLLRKCRNSRRRSETAATDPPPRCAIH